MNNIQVQRPVVTTAPPVAASPPMTVMRRSVVGTVSNVDVARNQVTVMSGSEQLLLQLPAGVVRDLRPGDQLTVDLNVRPGR